MPTDQDVDSIRLLLQQLRRRSRVLRNDAVSQGHRAWHLRVAALNVQMRSRELVRRLREP